MTKLKTNYLKLIVDNTGESKLRSLLTKQKKLIRDKIKAQDQIKAMKALTEIYGSEIIKIEKLCLFRNFESLKIDSPAPPKMKLGRKKTNLFCFFFEIFY